MSTDRLALTALEKKAEAELRYFELVELYWGDGQQHRCYVCVGNHALFLVQRSLSGLYPDAEAGELYYAHIDRVVEDTKTTHNLLLVLNDNRNGFWEQPNLLVVAEHRSRLLVMLQAAWQTDYSWRISRVAELPRWKKELPGRTGGGDGLCVRPFQGYKLAEHEGYRFFIGQDYSDIAGNIHSGSMGTWVDKKREVTFILQVQEPEPLSRLEASGSEHIRWVAMRIRQAVAESLTSALVERSAFYYKKMNLANDIAPWTGWEVFLKSDTLVQVMIFLRRQHLPPMADSAQDIFITVRCPRRKLDENVVTDEHLLAEARLAADSMSPVVQRCTVPQTMYRDMIQAKLDALLFSEDSMTWLKNSIGLQPDTKLLGLGKSFVRSILKILQEENALESPALMQDIGEDVPTEKEPMVVAQQMARFHLRSSTKANQGEDDPTFNSWHARVARYLAYCFDGGLLGPRLSLKHMTKPFIPTPQSQQKIDDIVIFLLHIRPKDLTKKFVSREVRHIVCDPNIFDHNTFNDRVMQSLVELKWFEKVLGRSASSQQRVTEAGTMDSEFARFLARMLACKKASINLKAAVCRQLDAAAGQQTEHFGVFCPALLETMHAPGVHLRTYATLTLVNMSAGHVVVQNTIIKLGVLQLCMDNMRSSDDNLIHTTLSLLTHLSKNLAQLEEMNKVGISEVVMSLLEKTPSIEVKQDLLCELASVIGQFCVHDELWKAMREHPCRPVDKLVSTYQWTKQGGKLRSKAMFALKMFCDRPSVQAQGTRDKVAVIMPLVVDDLRDITQDTMDMDHDHAMNAIIFLSMLTRSPQLTKELAKQRDVLKVLTELNMTELGKMDSIRDRLHKLILCVESAAKTLR